MLSTAKGLPTLADILSGLGSLRLFVMLNNSKQGKLQCPIIKKRKLSNWFFLFKLSNPLTFQLNP